MSSGLYGHRSNSSASSSPPATSGSGQTGLVVPQPINAAKGQGQSGNSAGHQSGNNNSGHIHSHPSNGSSGRKYQCKMCPQVGKVSGQQNVFWNSSVFTVQQAFHWQVRAGLGFSHCRFPGFESLNHGSPIFLLFNHQPMAIRTNVHLPIQFTAHKIDGVTALQLLNSKSANFYYIRYCKSKNYTPFCNNLKKLHVYFIPVHDDCFSSVQFLENLLRNLELLQTQYKKSHFLS